jgi:hypothetical protein
MDTSKALTSFARRWSREEEPALIALARRSAIVGSIERGMQNVETIYRRSHMHQSVGRYLGSWRAQGRFAQRRAAGVLIPTAVAVHLVMTMAHDRPAGWYWLAVPAIAAAQGALLVIMSNGAKLNR